MRRRRWPLVFALALVALMAGIIFWPRHDDYGFLRELHPTETVEVVAENGVGMTPGMRLHMFTFTQPYSVVKQKLLSAGARLDTTFHPMAHLEVYKISSNVSADVGHYPGELVRVTISGEEPTWIQTQIEAIKGFLHL